VNPVNDPPQLADDPAQLTEDGQAAVAVLANDVDIDGSLLPSALSLVVTPTHGSAVINFLNGEITYTPEPDWNGTDSFTYQACDNGAPLPALCGSAQVLLSVQAVNDPPQVLGDSAATEEITPLEIAVLDNDSDPDDGLSIASLQVTSGPSHGTAQPDPQTGVILYSPAAGWVGPDVFDYQVCDMGTPPPVLCGTATVDIIVGVENDPPVLVSDLATTPEDTAVLVDVSANDYDIDGNLVPESLTVYSAPAHGLADVTDGKINYTPVLDWNGVDSLRYRACDDGWPLPAACSTGWMTVTVEALNDPPVVVSDTARPRRYRW
jgi:hypothetical protein